MKRPVFFFIYLLFRGRDVLLLIIQGFFVMILVLLQTNFLLYLDFLCKQTSVHILQLRSVFNMCNAKCF